MIRLFLALSLLSGVALAQAPTYGPVDARNLGASITALGKIPLPGTVATNGPNPTLSACGTSPSLTSASSNFMGTATVGSGSPLTCTITFATAAPFVSAPKCLAQASVSGMPVQAAVTVRSATVMTIQFASAMTNGTVDYTCTQ